jgi:hypothetical protein
MIRRGSEIGGQCHSVDHRAMANEPTPDPPGEDIPDRDRAAVGIALGVGTLQHQQAILRESKNGGDVERRGWIFSDPPAAGAVPDAHRATATRGRDPLAIRRKAEMRANAGMIGQGVA